MLSIDIRHNPYCARMRAELVSAPGPRAIQPGLAPRLPIQRHVSVRPGASNAVLVAAARTARPPPCPRS